MKKQQQQQNKTFGKTTFTYLLTWPWREAFQIPLSNSFLLYYLELPSIYMG